MPHLSTQIVGCCTICITQSVRYDLCTGVAYWAVRYDFMCRRDIWTLNLNSRMPSSLWYTHTAYRALLRTRFHRGIFATDSFWAHVTKPCMCCQIDSVVNALVFFSLASFGLIHLAVTPYGTLLLINSMHSRLFESRAARKLWYTVVLPEYYFLQG